MKIVVLSSCLAIVTLIPKVSGYPTGAPPEGCRSMLPGHGVPAQTGTTNPYTVMTDRTVFSCPGDEIRVTLRGEVFRGFLCAPIPNTGNLVQDMMDPVMKQNKCGQMASFTHVDNNVKSSISFLWKPQTVQTVVIVCTVVQSKYFFWVNVTSPELRYVKANCNRAPTEQEPPEQSGTDAERTSKNDVTNVVKGNINPSDTGIDTLTDKGGVISGPEKTMPEKGGKSKDLVTQNRPEKGGMSKDEITRNKPEKGGKSKDAITDPDFTDTADADGKGTGHKTSGAITYVLSLVICMLYL